VLARFISADTIVPDPANPQALNRYAYVLNNPLRYTDPSGHAEKDPFKRFLCDWAPQLCQPSTPPLLNEQQAGQALSAQQAPVMLNNGAQVPLYAAKREGEGEDKGGGIGGLIGSLLRLLGGGGAGKAAQELSKDGDPTNEIRNFGNSANTFAEGFSRTEQQLILSLVKKLGLENKGITFWRGEGAPEAYRASAATDKPYITIFDGFFKLSRQQQLKVLRGEWNHLQQNIQVLSDDLIRYYEQQAKRGQ
jgi:hypothetical protein